MGRFPVAVALSPDGTRAYVANFTDGTLSIVNTGTDQVIKTVKVGRDPDGVLQVGAAVYVANLAVGRRSAWSTRRRVPSRGTITLTGTATPAPSGLAASADGNHLYVDDARNGTTCVIDLTTAPGAVVGNVGVGTYPAYLAVHGTAGFVANATKAASIPGTVSVLNLADSAHPAVAHTIAVGSHPYGIALLSGLGEALVANSGDGTVSVIDTSTNSLLTTLAVGNTPDGIAVTPDQSTAVVANEGDNTVSIVPVTGWRDLWDQTERRPRRRGHQLPELRAHVLGLRRSGRRRLPGHRDLARHRVADLPGRRQGRLRELHPRRARQLLQRLHLQRRPEHPPADDARRLRSRTSPRSPTTRPAT